MPIKKGLIGTEADARQNRIQTTDATTDAQNLGCRSQLSSHTGLHRDKDGNTRALALDGVGFTEWTGVGLTAVGMAGE